MNIVVETPITETPRVQQIRGIFDLAPEKTSRLARDENCGILWTSHNMHEVEEVCDRVLFLSHGKILLAGDPRVLPSEHGAATLEELFIHFAREPLAPSAGSTR